MQTIREIRTVGEEQIVLNLPNIFRGQKVQIIVIPVQNERHFRKKSLRGVYRNMPGLNGLLMRKKHGRKR